MVSSSIQPQALSRLYNSLVEIDPDGNATPELAESWEAKPGAIEWIFNIRKGVTFSNGKTLDADDVIYSVNLHRESDTTSGGAATMKPIKDIQKLSKYQILIRLDSADSEMPAIFADYHMHVVPTMVYEWLAGPRDSNANALDRLPVRRAMERYPLEECRFRQTADGNQGGTRR
jgi:peptide/nickel transport system substrate-binding protein